jgi:putative component of membrane protein insertase Oxa1/YidC/SpoIIIJ protein YidD
LSLFASYKELPPISRCHPWFRGGLLLVPFVNSPEGAMALLFERDKQVNTRFHLREAKKL